MTNRNRMMTGALIELSLSRKIELGLCATAVSAVCGCSEM